MLPKQLIKATIFTAIGVVLIGIIYSIAGAMSTQVIFALLLGFVAAVVADILLFIASRNSNRWQLYYAIRILVILSCVITSVLLRDVLNPAATVLALIISLPAVAIANGGGHVQR